MLSCIPATTTALDIVIEPDLLLTRFHKSGFELDALLTVNALDVVVEPDLLLTRFYRAVLSLMPTTFPIVTFALVFVIEPDLLLTRFYRAVLSWVRS
jgi:hypothetical protein